VGYDSKHLIEVEELSNILDHDSIVVIDMRKPEEFQIGHIPNAINIWRTDIQQDTLPYEGMIASKQKIELLLGSLGVDNNDYLVIYDDKAMCNAARLWWVLDYYGFENTAILHGGIKAWQKIGKVSTEVVELDKKNFVLPQKYIPTRYISLHELKNSYNDTARVILDTRSKEEYQGDYIKKGAFDRGRIPRSINIDWGRTVDYDEHTFKSKEELLKIYSSENIIASSKVITYCHTGVRSAHTTFVLTELLGFSHVKNFDGSWTEWSYHQLPMVRDSLEIE
jgi:thiosulfate/3-mercaptopyruvate sulfurtransferase